MRQAVLPAALTLLLALVLLAGCAQDAPTPAGPVAPTPEAPSVLYGIVLDEAVRPIAGAAVTVTGANLTALSSEDGSFAFPDTVPRERPLVLVASSPGHQSASVQASLPAEGGVQVRIVLPLQAADTGFRDVLKFDGVIGCQASLAVSEEEPRLVDCGGQLDPGKTNWTFAASPKLVAAVVEVSWTAGQPLAEGLGATLTHVEPGAEPSVLSEVVGRSPLRLVVAQQVAAQRFAQGGELRLDVYARPVTDEDEQAVAATVAAEQKFQAFASLFYGVAPDPTYSFVTGTGS
jgi:Carboxypeptidase regulatory-like domain